MKKRIGAVLSAFILLSSLLSGCALGDAGRDPSYYEQSVLDRIYEGAGDASRMTGMAEDVAVLERTVYDDAYVSAAAAGLFAEDEKAILYTKEPTKRIYPASMTKCMTALLVLEHSANLKEEVQITEEAYRNLTPDSSTANLKVGGYYTVEDLLYALLLPSANEAANALALYVSGDIGTFVKEMNERAADLGMFGTQYRNPHGLHDSKHYTTVYDLYLLFRVLISKPDFLRIAGTEKAVIHCRYEDEVTDAYITTTNSFIRKFTLPPEGVRAVAGKTGYTASAGRCLVMLFENEAGLRYISVIARASSYDGVYEETVKLLELIP